MSAERIRVDVVTELIQSSAATYLVSSPPGRSAAPPSSAWQRCRRPHLLRLVGWEALLSYADEARPESRLEVLLRQPKLLVELPALDGESRPGL